MDDTAVAKAEALGLDVNLFVEACNQIRNPGTSCIVIYKEQIIHQADGRSVAPLLELYDEDRAKLEGSTVIDRIIGKAAAMILVLGKAKSIYGDILSVSAAKYLSDRGVAFQYGQMVDRITDRTGEGLCPIESSVIEIEDPEAGLYAIMRKLDELRA